MELSDMNKQKIAEAGVMAIHQEGVPSPDETEKILEEGVTTIPVDATGEEAASIGSVFKAVLAEHSHKESAAESAAPAADESLSAAAQADRDKVMEFGVMAMPQEVAAEEDAAARKAKEVMEAGITSIRE